MKKIRRVQHKVEPYDKFNNISIKYFITGYPPLIIDQPILFHVKDSFGQLYNRLCKEVHQQEGICMGICMGQQNIISEELEERKDRSRQEYKQKGLNNDSQYNRLQCFQHKVCFSKEKQIKMEILILGMGKQYEKQELSPSKQIQRYLELKKTFLDIGSNIFKIDNQKMLFVLQFESRVHTLTVQRYDPIHLQSSKSYYHQLQTYLYKINVISMYNQLYSLPLTQQCQEDKEERGKGSLTPIDLHDIVKQLKQSYPSQRWRQIQNIVLESFKQMQGSVGLLDVANEKIRLIQKQKRIFFSSLGKKKIYQNLEKRNKIYITFPNSHSFHNFLLKYNLSRQYLPIPQITGVYPSRLTIEQQFVNAFPLKFNIKLIQKFIDLAGQVSKIPAKGLPVFRLSDLVTQIQNNIEIWNWYTHKKYQLQGQQIKNILGELTKIGKLIDGTKTRTIYRDINFTNILIDQKDNLFLVDFEMISVGTFILDLVFLLNDKYNYLQDQIVAHALIYFWNKEKQNQILDFFYFLNIFYQCSYFLTFRWLLQLTKIYIKDQQSFHMDLRVLLLQLLRSTLRIKKFLQPKQYQIVYESTLKLVGGFLEMYRKIWKRQNLEEIVDKIYVCVGLSVDEQSLAQQKIKKVGQNNEKQIHKINYAQLQREAKEQKVNIFLEGSIDRNQIILFRFLRQIFLTKASTHILIGCPPQLSFLISHLFGFSVTILEGQNNQQQTQLLNTPRHQNIQNIQTYTKIKIENRKQQMLERAIIANRNSSQFSAIILSAGYGSRLGYKHKALVRIGNMTLIERWVEKIIQVGVTQVIIAQLQSRFQQVRQLLEKYTFNYPLRIIYKKFKKPIGAGATVFQCSKLVETRYFFAISCDVFSNFSLQKLYPSDQSGTSILGITFDQGRFYTDKVSKLLKIASGSNEEQFITFGGLGLFQTELFIQIGKTVDGNSFEFGQILEAIAKQTKVRVINLENEYLVNINEGKDIIDAENKWQNAKSDIINYN